MCKNKKDQMFFKEMNKIHKKLNMKRLQQLTCKIDHIYLQLISYTKAIEYHCISLCSVLNKSVMSVFIYIL